MEDMQWRHYGTGSHLNPLTIRSCSFVDMLTSCITTYKADCLDPWLIAEEIDSILATVDNAEDSLWHTSHDSELGQDGCSSRITLGWFEDQRVTGGERGSDRPKWDHGGEVESGGVTIAR